MGAQSIEKKDVYQRITDQIVSAIEAGAVTFKMPWKATGNFIWNPMSAASKKSYRGINTLILWAAAQEKSYSSGTWATYRQWTDLGGQVRKGEKSTSIVFWKFFDLKESEEASSEDKPGKRIPMARDYCVFNADQVDGYEKPKTQAINRGERIAIAEEFFTLLGADVRHNSDRASYNSTQDIINMPAFEMFKEPLFYYSVLSHETTHWTGSEKRFNRNLENRFGTEGYAMEELIAELGAAFLCCELGLPSDPRVDHAPYIATWLKVLKNDKRAIFSAAA